MKKMKKPKISVIVSAYNAEKYIKKCLIALMEQTLRDIEVICINDASSDDTLNIIKKTVDADERFVIINNTKNVGVSRSRNIGIKNARADFVMFCDADDYYDESMCEEMYKAVAYSSRIDMGISEINVIYEAHREMKYSDDNYYSLKYTGIQKINDDLILNTDLSPTNKIFKKKVILDNEIYFPENLYYEDAYFCVAYFCCCRYVNFINDRLYNYIRHEKSTMSDTWSTDTEKDPAIDHLYIAFELFEFLKKKSLIDNYNELYWNLFYSFELFALSNSKTVSRKKRVKNEASEFCKKNEVELEKTPSYIKEKILSLNSLNAEINKIKIKRVLIRFMPTYRLQVENIQRLRGLKNNMAQLNEKVDSLSSRKNL